VAAVVEAVEEVVVVEGGEELAEEVVEVAWVLTQGFRQIQ
jgi:acyl-CoA synthetase (NDP forming)